MNRLSTSRFHTIALSLAVLAGTVGSAIAAPATAPAPATSPGTDEIQKDYDAGKYQEAIKRSVQLLQLPGEAGKAVDKAKVYSLKAESHLHLKQNPLAIDAWNAAAKESSDAKAAATYRATAMLVKKSVAGKYQPKPADAKSPRPEALDVLAPESRKAALNALFTDESATVTAKVEALKKQKALPPVMEGVKQVSELRTLELAATDSDTTTKQIYTDLTAHAVELITAATTTMSTRVEEISKLANETQSSNQIMPDGSSRTVNVKRGLFSKDTNELKEVVSTSKNIVEACDGFAKALGTTTDNPFDAVKATAEKLGTRANEVATADYGSSVGYGTPTQTTGQPTNPTRPKGRYGN